MRKILFRGFHPDENGTRTITLDGEKIKGEWVYGDLIHRQIWASALTIIRESDDGFDNYEEYEVLPETVGQYTGLLDKNKNKIFEGDIVKLTPPNEKQIYVSIPHDPEEDRILKVVFFNGMFAVDMSKWFKYGHGKVALESYETERLEIIGNIYDSVELLEVEE